MASALTLKITSNEAENITLTIKDASGRSVQQATISANAGTTSALFNIEKLPAGVYYLNAELNGKPEKVSFVKK